MSDKKIMKTLNGYTVYDEDAHRRIDSLEGAAPGLVFDTVADMEAYVAEHSAELKVGQNLYIREVDVPDYWWDGTAAQELEVKEDLSGYAKQEEVDQLSEAIADKADKTGWAPGKYIGTDAAGNMVEKEAPQTGTGGITEETDPTVPSWAKQAQKPTYTASEVGALPASTKIPGKTSDLENDSGYITIAVATLLNYYLKTETYAKTETYSQTEIDNLISGLDNRLKAIADSDDTTLDQLSEIVAYIKSNKSLIDSITTSKVNVADIVNNLTTADAKKPLSAAQGKELKALYDSLPSWAKASNKPSYNKSEVGLGNVDNVRQYSASNPPPYPVKSVNGKTGAVTLGAADVGAATTEQLEQLSKEIADKQPKGDYALRSEIPSMPDVPVQSVNGKTGAVQLSAEDVGATTQDYVDSEIADIKAQGVQQTPLYPIGETVDECLAWLAENGDQTKLYALPDGMIYAYMTIEKEVEGGPAYTNLLPTAKATDRTTIYGGDYNGDGVADGYKEKTRLSGSSGSETTNSSYDMISTGFIPAKDGDILRVRGYVESTGTTSAYIIAYNSSNTRTGNIDWYQNTGSSKYTYDADTNTFTVPLTASNFGSGFDAIRFCCGSLDNGIVTINQEIKEGGGAEIITVTEWANTGHAFVPADYEDRIIAVEERTLRHTAEISALQKSIESGGADETESQALKRIREWDKPVYDPAPITLIADDRAKPALTTNDRTIPAIYAKYRELMAEHPDYIKEINMGKSSASDTFTAVDMLRFDFCEPGGLTAPSLEDSARHETKPTLIFLSGIHAEWAGVWGLYYALEEIATNPDFDDVRRNAHIVVIPCANPYCLTSQTAVEGWRMSRVNANGVAIHNNFGVNHSTSGNVGEYNYGGSTAYSEPETQYIDAVMAEYPDAVAFVSCHNNDYSTYYGSHVIWASSATYHMCNVTFRLVDKLTKAWLNKYGQALRDSIDQYKINMDANDYRLGRATMSTSKGTEQLNATKYGIMGVNLEISRMMKVFSGSTDGTSEVMTHGAEVYANFMRTLLWNYDHNDKKVYAPNLPWKD